MGKPSSEVVQFALVGPGRSQALMAHIIVSKFGDHLPSRLARAATRRDRVPIVLHADDTPARCWPLEPARPTPATCGPMCAMNGLDLPATS
jgi:hypothetical protein